MRLRMSREELLDRISQIIEPSIPFRRGSQALELGEESATLDEIETPIRPEELELFILQCPFSDPDIADWLVAEDPRESASEISLRAEELKDLLGNVEDWSNNQTWLAADEWPLIVDGPEPGIVLRYEDYVFHKARERFNRQALEEPNTYQRIVRYAPSVRLLQRIREDRISLDSLDWRDFEKLVAELLEEQGYDVELMRGTKDGGTDIVAVTNLEGIGPIKSVWQAKCYKPGNKVGINVVRELADVRQEHKASKGIIVTTSYLTRGALDRIRRDTYQLSKVDRDELDKWIERIIFGRR